MKRGSFVAAVVVAGLLSVLLGWLPVVGPFLAGFAGSRRACCKATSIGAASIVAVLWASAIVAMEGLTLSMGGQSVTLEPSVALPAICGPLIAGGMFGAYGGRSAIAWAAVLMVLGWGGYKAHDIYQTYQELMPRRQPAYDDTKNRTCPENLRQLYIALQTYADGWDGVLPPADRWLTAIRANVPNDAWLRCPDAKGAGDSGGYAMNSALGSERLESVKDRAKTPLLYDSKDVKTDAHDTFASAPKPGRHMGRNNVLFADGQVRSEAPK